MEWREQKLNTCFPLSPDNCTAPACQYALRALLFSASFHPHALYTFVCCEDTTEWEAMTSVTRIFLERAAFDEMRSEIELALPKFWEFMKVWEYLPRNVRTYFEIHLENNPEVVQE